MKNLLMIFLVMIVSSGANIAQTPCATEMPQEQIDWLKNYKSNPFNSLEVSRANNFYYIPVKIHIVGDDNGNGYYKMKFLISTMCELNSQFAPVGFYFYVYGDIHYMNNSSMYNHTGYTVGSIVSANNNPNAVNIYFVENPAGACGYFSGGWGGNPYIAINKSCAGIGNSTVAHELGHYFSLPHTFYGWENRNPSDAPLANDERVNGSNCSSRGDYFCDTPADYISDRWNCPYTGTKKDYSGDTYAPDGALYMSYANDACQNYFSVEQTDAMIEYLNSNSRRFLLNQPQPDTSIGTFAQILYPFDEQTGVPSNYVQLKWDRVQSATHYFVTGTRFTNPNSTSFEIVTTDTFLLLEDLTPGFRYRWKVKPFNNANFCAPYSDEYAFITTAATSIHPGMIVTPITCSGVNNASVLLNPIGGIEPYQFNWSNGEVNNQLFNLSPGTYFVTISDGNGASLTLNIDIISPKPLDIQFSQSGSVITANITGGTPPFSYLWHNGVTGISTAVFPGEFYSVKVTDSNGCNWYRDSNGLVSVEEFDIISGLRIYPNPVSNAHKRVNIEFTVSAKEIVYVSLFDFSGRKVIEFSEEANRGIYSNQIDFSSMPSGIYFVKVSAGSGSLNRKIIVQ
jgi:hypothetical protein